MRVLSLPTPRQIKWLDNESTELMIWEETGVSSSSGLNLRSRSPLCWTNKVNILMAAILNLFPEIRKQRKHFLIIVFLSQIQVNFILKMFWSDWFFFLFPLLFFFFFLTLYRCLKYDLMIYSISIQLCVNSDVLTWYNCMQALLNIKQGHDAFSMFTLHQWAF